LANAARVQSTDGVEIAVHDLGGRGAPLLIAHATGFCGGAYAALAAGLTSQFHVWALDFRGHGDSTSPTGDDFSWTGMGEDLVAVAEHIGEAPYAGFGHSMGGAAVLLAEQARPGLFHSAFLYEPIVIPPGAASPAGGAGGLAAGARRRRAEFASKDEVLWRYATRPPLNVLRADALAAYIEHGFRETGDGTVRLKCEPENEARTFDAGGGMTGDRVAGIELETTIAVGARGGGEGPPMYAPPLVASLPRATLLEYAHLGHFGPLQDPDTVAADVAARCGGARR
jgi:pimeloyl-ACP methyl ester carboxylesterase